MAELEAFQNLSFQQNYKTGGDTILAELEAFQNVKRLSKTGLMGILTRPYKTGLMGISTRSCKIGGDTILGKGKGYFFISVKSVKTSFVLPFVVFLKTSNDRYIKVNTPLENLDQRPGTLSLFCSNLIMMLVMIFWFSFGKLNKKYFDII